jgi:deoxycytidine triphosphate deaminase
MPGTNAKCPTTPDMPAPDRHLGDTIDKSAAARSGALFHFAVSNPGWGDGCAARTLEAM